MTDKFLSTPSGRRATTCCRCGAACGAYFYPRPPRGGRRSAAGLEGQAGRFLSTPSARRATLYNHRHAHCCQISIHALREEGDECREHAGRNQCISIHALREEGDQRQPCIVAKLLYFYPRPPRGGRPSGGFAMGYVTKFLSTPSARRAMCFS